jgi:hypothetical protein
MAAARAVAATRIGALGRTSVILNRFISVVGREQSHIIHIIQNDQKFALDALRPRLENGDVHLPGAVAVEALDVRSRRMSQIDHPARWRRRAAVFLTKREPARFAEQFGNRDPY